MAVPSLRASLLACARRKISTYTRPSVSAKHLWLRGRWDEWKRYFAKKFQFIIVCSYRFNRTLKTRIFKSFLLRSSLNWVDELDKIVDSYNNTKHRTTGMTPKAASERKHETFLLETVYWKKNNRPRGVAKFKVGDAVRISRKSHIFNRWKKMKLYYLSQHTNYLPKTKQGLYSPIFCGGVFCFKR